MKKNTKNFSKIFNFRPVLNQYYQPNISSIPRDKGNYYNKPQHVKTRQKWNIKNSIFREWKKCSEELIQNCFETDWSMNKIYRMIKNPDELQAVRNHFKQYYLQYMECYRRYAVIEPIGKIFSISMIPMQ
jgi:hypothetical protein